MVGLVCDFLQLHQIAPKQLSLVINLVSSAHITRRSTNSVYVHGIWQKLITVLPSVNERLVSVDIVERILDPAKQESILVV